MGDPLDNIDDCDTVTLTLPPGDDEITISLDDDFGLPNSIYAYSKHFVATNAANAINITTDFPPPNSITLGNVEITEDKVEKLQALYDVLMDDPEWVTKINTQIAFNRLGNKKDD